MTDTSHNAHVTLSRLAELSTWPDRFAWWPADGSGVERVARTLGRCLSASVTLAPRRPQPAPDPAEGPARGVVFPLVDAETGAVAIWLELERGLARIAAETALGAPLAERGALAKVGDAERVHLGIAQYLVARSLADIPACPLRVGVPRVMSTEASPGSATPSAAMIPIEINIGSLPLFVRIRPVPDGSASARSLAENAWPAWLVAIAAEIIGTFSLRVGGGEQTPAKLEDLAVGDVVFPEWAVELDEGRPLGFQVVWEEAAAVVAEVRRGGELSWIFETDVAPTNYTLEFGRQRRTLAGLEGGPGRDEGQPDCVELRAGGAALARGQMIREAGRIGLRIDELA